MGGGEWLELEVLFSPLASSEPHYFISFSFYCLLHVFDCFFPPTEEVRGDQRL